MAMVAAAVANDGELMEPRLWSKVIDTDGREEELDPERQSRVMSEDTAETLTEMMTDVVNEGTGGAAALGDDPGGRQDRNGGDRHRARTSTRPGSSASRPRTTPRSRSRRPSSAPAARAATVAAPIAQQVMEVLLGESDDDDGLSE